MPPGPTGLDQAGVNGIMRDISMNEHRFSLGRIATLGVGILVGAALLGCTAFSDLKHTTEKITNNIGISGNRLVKIMGVAPFEDKTPFGERQFARFFQTSLMDYLVEACPEYELLRPGEAGYPQELAMLPRKPSGRISSLDLAQTGRHLGLNAILSGAIVNISGSEEKKGILWFKDVYYYIQVQVVVELYDTETGAKILDRSVSRQFEVDESEYEAIRSHKLVDFYAVNEALQDASNELAWPICDALKDKAWTGFITSVDGQSATLSCGENQGLAVDDVLNVYNSFEIIDGSQEQQFFSPGAKSAEIRITAIYPDRAQATLISGDPLRAGSSVRMK